MRTLQLKADEANEESEHALSTFSPGGDINEFIQRYVGLRTRYHERSLNLEKYKQSKQMVKD